ncbi:hypothetical protein [Mycobacterium montefiorense]|uniref:Uncharacterized protein n=1 Tax=Mycobacterium montefiorense TaxID=154654 RepID=A0AA37PLR1_9MYCO|nr:hypothetical protein [Mycobacterium montefiorense]MCV7426667.1 hypothetical protein [Mycobacterium montefiorense]GKU32866.1 hypothetical protein NJB14191_02130 [Mycobacterium montefiorense]GKU42543.1 hypothetical protein NJB14192_45260 [Mycobacterium montefiorense]GKU48300.1 hypothetical protein NJB14194_49150 [Mycobacterium montefiorense]GKU64627.1 hypothetical protein NJB18182_51270 [Mycobacterium montefiorense]
MNPKYSFAEIIDHQGIGCAECRLVNIRAAHNILLSVTQDGRRVTDIHTTCLGIDISTNIVSQQVSMG